MWTSPRAAATRIRGGAGFTLIEVMAAVLVVGLLYTVLASSYIEAVSRVGTSRRAVYASLLADAALAEIEQGMAQGVPPPLDRTEEETEDDLYTLVVEVTPFDVLSLIPPELLPQPAPGTAPAAPGLLDPDRPEQARLRRVEIRVSWEELGMEQQVVRSTLAFDTTGLSSLLPTGAGTPVDAEGNTGSGDDGEFTLQDAMRQFEQLESQSN